MREGAETVTEGGAYITTRPPGLERIAIGHINTPPFQTWPVGEDKPPETLNKYEAEICVCLSWGYRQLSQSRWKVGLRRRLRGEGS